MKKITVYLLAMLTVLPVFAQDQNAPEPEVIQIDLRILSFGLEQFDAAPRSFRT
jgi:hypothetical protein